MLNVLDLFSGIGGISLGLERTGGFRTVAFCEIEPYPVAVLNERWPDVPVFGDVRTLSAGTLRDAGIEHIDVICGGFPCTDISVAGKQKGIAEGTRSGLWFEFARLIRDIRPAWCLIENVSALRTNGADLVLADLEAAGYSCWPLVVGADDIGAPHRRKRVWIVAHRNCIGCDGDGRNAAAIAGSDRAKDGVSGADGSVAHGPDQSGDGRDREPGCEVPEPRDGGGEGSVVADTSSAGLEGLWSDRESEGYGCGAAGSASASGLFPCRVPREDRDDFWCERHGMRAYDRECPAIDEWAGHGVYPCQYVHRWPSRPGEPQHDWEPPRLTESRLGRNFDGSPDRLESRIRRERLKALGNGVVPQIPEVIGRAILAAQKAGY